MYNIYFNGDLLADNLTENETLEKLREYYITDGIITLDKIADMIDYYRRFFMECISYIEISNILETAKSLESEKLLEPYEIAYSDDENAKISAYDFVRERGIEI